MRSKSLSILQRIGIGGPSAATRRRQLLFEKEFQYAVSRLVDAIEAGRRVDVSEGLDSVGTLLKTAVNVHARQTDQDVHADSSGGPSEFGREWGELLRALDDIRAMAGKSGDQRRRSQVLDFFWEASIQLLRGGHYAAARNVLANLVWMWSDLDRSTDNWTSHDLDYFLLRLRDSCTYSTPKWTDRSSAASAATVYVYVFVSIIKSSMDQGNCVNAQAALDTFMEAREFSDRDEYQSAFVGARSAGTLLLLAWGLLRHKDSTPDSAAEAFLNSLVTHLSSHNTWATMSAALDDDLQRAVGANWWEINARTVRGRSAGFIEIDSYVRVGAVVVASQRATFSMPDPTPDVGAQALSLQELVKRVGESEGPFAVAGKFLTKGSMEKLEQELEETLTAVETARKEELAATPLDPNRISDFHAAMIKHLSAEPGLVPALSDSLQDYASEKPNFGISRLVPKYYFAHGGVHAEPERLAQEVVRSIRDGENQLIVEAADGAGRQPLAQLDTLKGQIQSWITERDPRISLIAFTNSWQVAEVLAPREARSTDSESTIAFTLAETRVPLVRLYDGEDPYFGIFDPLNGLRVALNRVEVPEMESGAEVYDQKFLTVLRAATREEVDRWVGDDVTSELDLLQNVVLKALESFEIATIDSDRVAFWPLPEDAI